MNYWRPSMTMHCCATRACNVCVILCESETVYITRRVCMCARECVWVWTHTGCQTKTTTLKVKETNLITQHRGKAITHTHTEYTGTLSSLSFTHTCIITDLDIWQLWKLGIGWFFISVAAVDHYQSWPQRLSLSLCKCTKINKYAYVF